MSNDISLRALWIISCNKNVSLPLFTRYFPTVERRCTSLLGNAYTLIPDEKDFVKHLLTEVGLTNADNFVESRDRCNKRVSFPAFELELETGSLWPVVVVENKGLLYCALPLAGQGTTLSDLPCVSMALDVLDGLVQCVNSSGTNITQGSPGMSDLVQFVAIALPFGRPICLDPFLASRLLNPTARSKVKQPIWNPSPHKGKSKVALHIKEFVRSQQWGRTEMQDVTEVYGTVTCKAEVEGMSPEISVTVTQPACDVVVSPAVNCVEAKSGQSCRLRFRPTNLQPLCHYTVPGRLAAPLQGSFQLKVVDSVAQLHVELRLASGMRNQFQHLEVKVPVPGTRHAKFRLSPSTGSAHRQGREVMWTIGSKLPSHSASLNASLAVPAGTQPPQPCYATVTFTMTDYTYSGVKIDPKSVVVSTAAKFNCSVASEFVAGQYRIWNSEGPSPVIPDELGEALEEILREDVDPVDV